MGDFAAVPVDGRYPLVYLVLNTIFASTTQEDQVRCFANVAKHLTEGGIFVLEAFLPDLTRYHLGQRVEALKVGVRQHGAEHVETRPRDADRSGAPELHIEDGKPVQTYPVKLRYAFPSELDLMARLGGLRLRDRWGGWEGEPYTGLNPRHVSVDELDPGSSRIDVLDDLPRNLRGAARRVAPRPGRRRRPGGRSRARHPGPCHRQAPNDRRRVLRRRPRYGHESRTIIAAVESLGEGTSARRCCRRPAAGWIRRWSASWPESWPP